MSHIEEGTTSLVFSSLLPLLGEKKVLAQHPCIKLLQQALQLVAQTYGGEVVPYYYDYYYEPQVVNTDLALLIPRSSERPRSHALPRGIGLQIDEQTGALTIMGDPWGVDHNFYEQVQHAIIQKYTVLAHMAALTQMQYHVTVQEAEGRVSITGVSHG